MKLPYTKQEDYLIPNIMIDMCFVLLNRNSIICLFCQLEFIKVNMIEAKYPVITGFLSQSVGIMQK